MSCNIELGGLRSAQVVKGLHGSYEIVALVNMCTTKRCQVVELQIANILEWKVPSQQVRLDCKFVNKGLQIFSNFDTGLAQVDIYFIQLWSQNNRESLFHYFFNDLRTAICRDLTYIQEKSWDTESFPCLSFSTIFLPGDSFWFDKWDLIFTFRCFNSISFNFDRNQSWTLDTSHSHS